MEERSKKNLAHFRQMLEKMKDNPVAEQFVRGRLSVWMKECPKDLVLRVGNLVANYRREELEIQDSSN